MNKNTFIKDNYREAFAKDHDLKKIAANPVTCFFVNNQYKSNNDKN